MARRSGLETADSWDERVRPVARRQLLLARQVTDGTVVILLLILLLDHLKRSADEAELILRIRWSQSFSNHILMLVVRKLCVELRGHTGFGESETRIVARRDARVADGADSGARSVKELLAMAANAGDVVRVIRHVRKISSLAPVLCRRLVARAASLLFVRRATVRKFRVVNIRSGGRRRDGARALPSLLE